MDGKPVFERAVGYVAMYISQALTFAGRMHAGKDLHLTAAAANALDQLHVLLADLYVWRTAGQ